MNKHGIIHALKTTYNTLKLFKLIHEGSIESDCACARMLVLGELDFFEV